MLNRFNTNSRNRSNSGSDRVFGRDKPSLGPCAASKDLKVPETALQRMRPKAMVIKGSFHGLLKNISPIAAVRPAKVVFLVNVVIDLIGYRDNDLSVVRINLLFAALR